MRDLWWEVCEKKNTSPDLVLLNQRLDVIQSEMRISQASTSKALEDIKQAISRVSQVVRIEHRSSCCDAGLPPYC